MTITGFNTLRSMKWLARRFYSMRPDQILYSKEVLQAKENANPVVALESTIITHGMPYPANLEMAKTVEQIIRENGAVPATVAIVNGNCHVGLNDSQLEILAQTGTKSHKTSRRDLAVVIARKLTGGTTVSGTMVLAHAAGIKVFVTGGIGGVHREGEHTMDISADLIELGRTPLAVVCAGSKSILDIQRTMEVLETNGVTVTTMGETGVQIPAFYARESGVLSPFNSPTITDVANLVYTNNILGLKSGTLICVPIPHEHAIPSSFINNIIDNALAKAKKLDIKGKDCTPFLLKEIAEATKGLSLKANIELVYHNAKVGSQIAMELAMLSKANLGTVHSRGLINHQSPVQSSILSPICPSSSKKHISSTPIPLAIIGSVAIDYTCTASSSPLSLHTSHTGSITRTVGGVGLNLARSAFNSGSMSVELLTARGKDRDGQWLESEILRKGFGKTSYLISEKHETAKYVAVHDGKGDLVVAVADMAIVEDMAEQVRDFIVPKQPRWIAMDGNLGSKTMTEIVSVAKEINSKVFFEPTSVPKSIRPLQIRNLGVYPNHSIHAVSPNAFELSAMFLSASDTGLFERNDWWEALNSLHLLQDFRNDVELFLSRHKEIAHLGPQGLIQQATHLLLFMPAIFLKLGSLGVLAFRIIPSERNIVSMTTSKILAHGKTSDLVIDYFPAVEQISQDSIVSVTGAGDSFAGSLLHDFSGREDSLFEDLEEMMERAQKAAVRALKSMDAVVSS
ncbi:Pseudouridine-metabolizing bifunctional protein [Neolecta irregularis DAH-3]|uniref:Pseudouridine-metabolizing bifunctional protein n=1 Tax=Neolecta irregularis (strain DAH-3) TaxID=1198029 RepID=A0A1U7LJ00_NEOID|nr:Pseudouridine-metabolizing bifunctional protein [Neolecta irregularis DAH-3]|eukprot:OLL22624.1 Pseudouridine-metabolizing bifunctional protein [Neolecta irregularis DAH-3]